MGSETGKEIRKRDRRIGAVRALAAFLPAWICAGLVASHAVDVPIWDDWERARLLEHSAESLDWAYLYSPHIDHRIVVPRLVALANARLFGGNLVLEMGLSFAVVLATALAFHLLLRRTLGTQRPAELWGTTFLANALLFTPLQWENLLWAAQPFFLWPLGAVVSVLLLLRSRVAWGVKLVLSLLLAIVTTHTFSHGLPIWALVPAAVLLQRDFAPRRGRAIFLGLWVAVAALVLVPYFSVGELRSTSDASHAFGMEPGNRAPGLSLAAALRDPVKVARFYGAMLGSPFARIGIVRPRDVAPFFGAGVTLLFTVSALFWLRRYRDDDAWNRGLPWVLLGGYGLGLCLLAAVGRSALMKWSYALLPHYASIAIYPLLAALPLGVLALRETRDRGVAPFAAGLLGVAIGVGWLVNLDGMSEWKSARLQARTALHFSAFFPPRNIERLDSSSEVVRRFAPVFDREGQLHPPLAPRPTLDAFRIEREPLPDEYAELARGRVRGAGIRVEGHAWLPAAGRRADSVVFAVEEKDGWRVVGIGELRGFPIFRVAEHDHIFNELRIPKPADFAAFDARLAGSALPESSHFVLVPFAVDAEQMRVHPLRQRIRVERPADGSALRLELVESEADA